MLGSSDSEEHEQGTPAVPTPMPTVVTDVSNDSGLDECDATAILVDQPIIEKTKAPTEKLTRTLQADEMSDSLFVKMESSKESGSFVNKIGKLAKKMKELGMLKSSKQKRKMVDCGVKEVRIRDAHSPAGTDNSADFGMHLKSVRENGLFRHFIAYKEKGSLADCFKFRDGDEFLMVEDSPIVGVSPLIALNYFWNLSVDQPVTFVTRRAMNKLGDNIVYEYFILSGTIHVFGEDDVVDAIERMSLEAAVGIQDLLDVRFVGVDQRSLRSPENVILRIVDGKFHLDPENETPFYFDVLEYEAVQIQHGLFQPVIIWIIRYSDDSSCYLLSKDDQNTDVGLLKDTKEALAKLDWKDFYEGGIKWVARTPEDSKKPHIFRSLSNPGVFLGSTKEKMICVEKDGWEAAECDTQTHFYVDPYA